MNWPKLANVSKSMHMFIKPRKATEIAGSHHSK